MLFSHQLPLSAVIDLCRALRHNLAAGLTLRHVFRQQAERGPRALRPLAERVSARIEEGHSLFDAVEPEKEHLPPLFLAMTRVGEQTGHLPEIFGELEKYFLLQQKLRRQFKSQSFMPIVQLVLAFLIIAGLILVLGWIAASRNSQPMRIFGLSGTGGALTFLVCSFGTLALIWAAFRILPRMLQKQEAVDRFLLRVPAVGPCLEAFAMGRFTTALQLTLDSGLAIHKGLRLSLDATGNSAYTAQKDVVINALKYGEPLTEALTRTRLFTVEFLNIVAVAEESGRIPEVMRQQAEYYHEEASRRLTTLTKVASMLVWLVYAGFMVWAIFSIAGVYFSALG
ncbi:MAG: type II secretion system F family protein [Gemmataceae bacterium]|nr:type II secretion system F family protein [Gemmataceae bacterium]